MYSRLYKFLTKNKILYPYQFGFRVNHSTSLALIEMIDIIKQPIEEGNHTLGIYNWSIWSTTGICFGSALGPLLFLLYINDLIISTNEKYRLFADDANSFISHTEPIVFKWLKQILTNINKWLTTNKLILNMPKMQRTQLQYQGIVLDNKLTWQAYIQQQTQDTIKISNSFIIITNYTHINNQLKDQ